MHSLSKVSLPLYEDIYVVSDLHLGGTQGVRIFKQGEKLAALIAHLASGSPPHGGNRALVLNGDIFDTLAEGPDRYVARPETAEVLLGRIMAHSDFAPVFSALKTYVSQKKHRLIINIGNHDLELVYPNVQEQIAARLGGTDNDAIRGRILFSTVGVGHSCRVGTADNSARVLCFHGNEYDNWNAVSPESMTRLARSACLGAASKIADDPPNAGTQLVIDVMNSIKKEYPFVDLLKPEIEAVFNILLALEPKTIYALPNVLKLNAKAKAQGGLRLARVLGEPAPPSPSPPSIQEWKPKGCFGAFLAESHPNLNLLDKAWALSASETPVISDGPESTLGAFSDFIKIAYENLVNRITQNPAEALRCAFRDWVGGDRNWDLNGPDDVYDEVEKLKPDADVVIAGHTHLRRQIHTQNYLYLNTGTWARLMRLDKPLLEDPNRFEALLSTLEKKSMDAIDALEGTVLNQGTVGIVRLKADGSAVEAALCEKTDDRDEPQPVDAGGWDEVRTHA